MKKTAKILLFALTCSLLASCGNSYTSTGSEIADEACEYETGSGYVNASASAKTSDNAYDLEESKDAETENINREELEDIQAESSQEKLVYTCRMTIQTLNFTEAQKQIKENIKKVNGIIEAEEITDSNYYWYNDSYKEKGTLRSNLTVRIPSDKYQTFLSALEGTDGKITGQSQSVENITKQYNDQSIYIENLKVQEQRLLDMMEKAESIEDMIAIEERLTEVQTELNQAKSNLSSMDTDVKYSTVYLNLEEVVKYTETKSNPISFSEKIKQAFTDSWIGFVNALENIIIAAIYLIPIILFIAAVGLIIFLLGKLFKKNKK